MAPLKIIRLVAIYSVLFILLGCSEQSKESNTIQNPDTLNEQITKSIDDFKNRPIHKILSAQIIDTTTDDKLLQVIFDNLIEKVSQDSNKEYATVLTWTKSQQAIYIIWLLEAEVNNGGYNQFFYNSSRQFADLAPEALKLVGAVEFADLTNRANKAYKKDKEIASRNNNRSLESLSQSYENDTFEKFDKEFYELYKKEDLQKIQIDYIRSHKMDFIDK